MGFIPLLVYRPDIFADMRAWRALKQLTETTDNIYRYGLLQKLRAKREQINRILLTQTAIFFVAPLAVAGIFSAVLMGKAMEFPFSTFYNLLPFPCISCYNRTVIPHHSKQEL